MYVSEIHFYGEEIKATPLFPLFQTKRADPGDCFYIDDDADDDTGFTYIRDFDGWEKIADTAAYLGSYCRTANEYGIYLYYPNLSFSTYNVYLNWPAIDTTDYIDSEYIVFSDVGSNLASTETFSFYVDQKMICGERAYIGEYIFNPSAIPWFKIG